MNRQSITTLSDSGSTQTIISYGTIRKNGYLRNIPVESCKPVMFLVAGGQRLTSKSKITFKLIIQSNLLEITAYILPTLGGVDLVLGTDSLKCLGAKLDFKTNKLKWKSKSVFLRLLKDITLQPGQTKTIPVSGKVPECLKNSEVYVEMSKFMQKFAPSLCLITLRKGSSTMFLKNITNKQVKIRSNKPIGTILLKRFGQIPVEAPISLTNLEYTKNEMNANIDKLSSIGAVESNNSNDDAICYSIKSQGAYHPSPKLPEFCIGNKNIPNGLNNAKKELYRQKSKKYPHLNSDDKRLWTSDVDILRNSLNLTDSVISEEIKTELWETMYRNIECYSLHEELGCVKNMEVKVELTDLTPFFTRPYSVSEAEKLIIDRELKKLMLLGVIERGMGSYCCPVFLLKKPHEKSGKYRVLGDFRILNLKIRNIHCSAPLLRDCLPIIGASEATIFSSLDVKGAFYSLPLDKQSQKYVNICSYPGGPTYRYLKLPQGCNISPSEYNNVMSLIMDDVPSRGKNVLYIADDLLIFSKTESDHIKHINEVLQAFKKHGLKLAPGKCEYFKKSIDYMGHRIRVVDGRPAIQAQKSKIEAVNNIETPRTPKQMKSMIGLVSYLSQYLPKLQLLLLPMHALSRKNCKFVWTAEHERNFTEIKKLVKSNQILSLPTADGLMKLYIDSSRIGVGCCVCQMQDNKEKILAYYSKKFPSSALNYSVSEIEFMGIWISVNAFRYILKGRYFEVYTDHNPLVQISRAKHEIPSLRLRKTFLKLSDYKYKIFYKRGKDMRIPDWLSRNPVSDINDNDAIAFEMHLHSGNTFAFQMQSLQCNKCLNKIDDIYLRHRNNSAKWQNNITCQECIQDDYSFENNNGNIVFPVTRSRAKAEGEELLPGLPAPVRAKRAGRNLVKETPPAIDTNTQPSMEPITIKDNGPALLDMDGNNTPKNFVSTDIFPSKSMPNSTSLIKPVDRNREKFITSPILDRDIPVTDYRVPEDEYFVEPKDLFDPNIPIDKWFHPHMPKGSDLERQLKDIKSRYISNSHLPINKQTLAQQQKEDPQFKPIYTYIMHNILPKLKRDQKRIQRMAESYAIADSILFKLDYEYPYTGEKQLRQRVCIPEKFVPYLLHNYHESLLACHAGVKKTYLNIRSKFFVNNLFNRIYDWVKSCHTCSIMKQSKDKNKKPLEININADYRPLANLALDIKYMNDGINGYKFILLGCCTVTRYLIAAPLRKADALHIAEALINIIFTWGPPTKVFMDMDRGFTNQLANLVYSALNIKKTLISPYVHNSLAVERHIGTISRFIMANLTGNGKQWPLYLKPAIYAYNCSPIVGLDISPYELVFVRKPPVLHDLDFPALDDIKTTYRSYASHLKGRLNAIGTWMTKLRTENQLLAAAEQADKISEPYKYQKGTVVYFLCPALGSLVTNSRKIKASYIGPLVISAVISDSLVTLEDLFGRKIHGVHSVARIKRGWIRTATGKAGTIDELKQQIHESEFNKILSNTNLLNTENLNYVFSIQSYGEPQYIMTLLNQDDDASHFSYDLNLFSTTTSEKPTDLKRYLHSSKRNSGLACKNVLSNSQFKRARKHDNKMPIMNSTLEITKTKHYNGELNVLLTNTDTPKSLQYSFWYPLHENSEIKSEIENSLKLRKIKIKGSEARFAKEIMYGQKEI